MQDRIKDLQELAGAATQGEWTHTGTGVWSDNARVFDTVNGHDGLYRQMTTQEQAANRAYGAAANPQTIKALLDALVKAEEALNLSRKRIEYLSGFCGERHEQGNTHFYHQIDESLSAISNFRSKQ